MRKAGCLGIRTYKFSKEAFEIFSRDNYLCRYCDKDLLESIDEYRTAQIDHIRPKERGGSDDLENKAVCCVACHSFKDRVDNRFDFDSAPKERKALIKLIAAEIAKVRAEVHVELREAKERFRS